ncbi:phage terminase small subunit P27 family [Anaerovoracaceae bacterium 41-7]|uniref:phage terminase small subunit P27 family n=1 Tax=Emergencia sp. JLR.KK010 TaxID=3114296 RepID=UPI0030D3F061
MAGARQPIEVILANGKKHLTKDEITARKNTEVKPIMDDIVAPDYLTKKQKEEFRKLSEQLIKLKIMGETDVDALARYIVANGFYINAVKQMRKPENKNDPFRLEKWAKIQERYFKQARSSANDLGLSISSRCRLVVPEAVPSTTVENKFKRFEKGVDTNE